MSRTATGTFDVKTTPQAPPEKGPDFFGRMVLDKTFDGDLAGTSDGLMLGVRTEVEGSAGYVAMEKFIGSLAGREGSFVMQHDGQMVSGALDLRIRIIPDSGTGGLAGISGSMNIEMKDGRHYYALEYELPT